MSKVAVENNRKQIIRNTLNSFFGVEVDEVNKENNIHIAIDKVDVDILTDAIDQALGKEKRNENTNQFEQ